MHEQQQAQEQLIEEIDQLKLQLAEAEARLAAYDISETELRRIHDALPVLVATAGLDGYYQRVNAAFERILGWTPEESLSRPFVEFIHPEDRARAREEFDRLRSGDPVINFIDRNVCKDGSHRYIRWMVIPLPEREIVYGIGQDVTRQLQTEQELVRVHADLDQRVLERTAALRDSNRRLRQEVGERREAEEQLSIFKTFAEASAQGFGMSDMDGRIVYCNAALARLLGEASPEHAYGKQTSTYYTDDYRNLRETEIYPVIEKQGSWQGELTLVSQSGQRIPVLQTSFTLVNPSGDPVRRGVVITDLREIKRAETFAEDKLRELEAIYEGLPDTLVLIELASLRFRRVNPAFCRMLGYTEEELLQMSVDQVYPVVLLSRVQQSAEDFASGTPMPLESSWMQHKDGTTIPVEISGTPVCIAGEQFVVGFARDATQKRQAESKVRESEARYRTLVESSPDAVVMADLEGRVVFASQQAAEMYGAADPGEIVGRPMLDFVAAKDHVRLMNSMDLLLRQQSPAHNEYTCLRADGTTIPIETSTAILRDSTDRPVALLSICRDITERRVAEETIRKEQDSLRRMLESSDRDLELITQEMHDGVATPVLAALMQFEAVLNLQRQVSDEATASFESGLAALRKASEKARSLMNRTRTPVLKKFGVKAAIADFIDQWADAPGAPEVVYRCEATFTRLEPALENAIFRVAQEAIRNACLHSGSELVRVALHQEGTDIILEVHDTGVGFHPNRVNSDRFGLHGIRERTRLLGKEVSIKSSPGQGTRILATFPLLCAKQRSDSP